MKGDSDMIGVRLCGDFAFSDTDIKNRDYIKALTTDCWMTISINDAIFYDDWICPLEFYFQYLKWKEEFLEENIQSFHYVSDDNAVNPILSFCFVDNQWVISSCLLDNQVYQGFTTEDILRFFVSYESQLFEHKI